jgi:hypothetical protein
VTGVLIDTSVWVAHFRQCNAELVRLLALDGALMHPLVQAELACGTPPEPRARTLADLGLLASTLLTPGAVLWTLDKRLAALAGRFGVSYAPGDGWH